MNRRWSGTSRLVLASALAWEVQAGAAEAGEAQPLIGGYVPGEGLAIRSATDDNYQLRVGLEGAYRLGPAFLNGASQNRTSIFSARPSLGGSLVRPWITFLTTAELADNPPYLLYAYLDVRPARELGVRFGQQNTPFSRHENFGLYRIVFPETGPVAGYFWSGRDKGLTLYGSVADRFDYYAGLYAGSPLRQFTTIAGNYVGEGRITFNPMGKMGDAEFVYALGDDPAPFRVSFTLQGYVAKIQTATQNFDPNSFVFTSMASGTTTKEQTAGADIFVQSRRVVFLTEGYVSRTNPLDGTPSYTSVGAWAQLGVLIFRRKLDAAVQGDWADPSTRLSTDRFLAGEGQVTYYVKAPTLIVKLRYAYADQQSPGMTALGPVKLPGTAGRAQLITLQTNLAF